MKSILLFLFLTSGFVFSQTITDPQKDFVNTVYYPASFILYVQTEGVLDGQCTATVVDKIDGGYELETASHCVCDENVKNKQVYPSEESVFFVSDVETEDLTSKQLLKASLKGCGYSHIGDDFAILTVSTGDTFPVVPLGTDPITMEPIVNVANALSLGKQVFLGSVSSSLSDRPNLSSHSITGVLFEDEIDWSKTILLQMFGVNHGSSGSSIVCLDQNAICGFVVGIYGGINATTSIALPVSRFIEVRKELAEGKYKYWSPKMEPNKVIKSGTCVTCNNTYTSK